MTAVGRRGLIVTLVILVLKYCEVLDLNFFWVTSQLGQVQSF